MAARDLQAVLEVSQPTLSRLVAASATAVVRIGRARATCYAASRSIDGRRNWPLVRIDSNGRPGQIAVLHAIWQRGWWWEPAAATPRWLRREFATGVFPDWPWPLETLRPEGFLGRGFARIHGPQIGVSEDLARWSGDDVLRTALRFGDDMPGNFLVGDAALARFQHNVASGPAPIDEARRESLYESLTAQAATEEVPGTSAGGEQPKFCVTLGSGDAIRHAIVKFSPPRETSAGRRWADLLACEHLALEVLAQSGIAASSASWFESASRSYLEVARFDRIGAWGRRAVVSLLHLDAAFFADLDDWPSAADRLERERWLGADDAATLRTLGWFGVFIGNSDMHFGNASLFLDDELPLGLAPAYDMLPMLWRPAPSGEVTSRPFEVTRPPPSGRPEAIRAARIAAEFWRRVESDERISSEFRAMVRGGADYVRKFLQRVL